MANPEYEQLLENLRLLKLGSLVPVLESHLKRAAKGSVSYQDFLAGLVREALQLREQRTRERRLAACRFAFIRRLDEFDWAAQPTLNRAELERLGSLRFIDDHDNVAFRRLAVRRRRSDLGSDRPPPFLTRRRPAVLFE